MFSKKHLQLTLLAVLLLVTPIYSQHKCTHDHTEHPEPEIIDPDTDNVDSEGRILADATYPNLRVKPYYGALSNNTVFATYVSQALIPPIADYFGAAVQAKYPLGSWFSMGVSSVCGISTPAELRAGVVGDIYWIIEDSYDTSSWVADSYACNLMKDSKRPYIGRTKINRYMFGATSNVLVHEKNMVCIMHEFVHVLGFSYSLYPVWLNPNGTRLSGEGTWMFLDGYESLVMDVEPLTSRLKAHFGCATVPGAYMENNGGSGTTNSHFERRQFANEIMTSGLIYEMAISEFTLALLEGTGWYTANYTYAEPHTFGQGQGCSFLNDSCDPNQHPEWCTGTARGCTTAGMSGSNCAADVCSDGCRFQHANPNYHCENPSAVSNARFPTIEVFGRGAGSKCFEGSLAASTASSATATSFCLKFTCVAPTTVPGAMLKTNWKLNLDLGTTTATCTKAGPLSVTGYKGTITCPDPLEYCTTVGSAHCPRNCMGRGNCVNGVCQCNAGFTGTDCALGPNGI